MKFLKRLWSLLFGKKEEAATIPADYTADLVVVNEIELAELEEIEEPIIEIPESVAEQLAGEAVVVSKKKKPAKKKKYNGNIT